MKRNSRLRKNNPRSPWWRAPMVNRQPNWDRHREMEEREQREQRS